MGYLSERRARYSFGGSSVTCVSKVGANSMYDQGIINTREEKQTNKSLVLPRQWSVEVGNALGPR